jgi:hypothetical protein
MAIDSNTSTQLIIPTMDELRIALQNCGSALTASDFKMLLDSLEGVWLKANNNERAITLLWEALDFASNADISSLVQRIANLEDLIGLGNINNLEGDYT